MSASASVPRTITSSVLWLLASVGAVFGAVVDDVSVEDLGCYGHPTIQTPNLDQLADNGLRFENAYLTISSCSPSRCSIISGRYPHNTGASELHTSLPSDQFMFPKALRDSGYYTVLSGKNHIGSATKSAFHKISSGKGPGREEDCRCENCIPWGGSSILLLRVWQRQPGGSQPHQQSG